MVNDKVLIYGLGEQYNRNFNTLKYFEISRQFEIVGVTAKHTPDAATLDGYPVIAYDRISQAGFGFVMVMSDIYFDEIVKDLTELGINRKYILSYRIL